MSNPIFIVNFKNMECQILFLVGGKRSEDNWAQGKQHGEGKFTTADCEIKFGVLNKGKRSDGN